MNSVLEVILKAKDELSSVAQKAGDKLDGLGKAAGLATAAVGVGLTGAAVGLFKLGESLDGAFDAIAVGTGASGPALEGLKADFRSVFSSVPTDVDSAALAIADFNTKVGATGEELQELSKTGLELSRLTGTDLATNIDSVSQLMNMWGVSAGEGSALMDKLFVASQATGVGVDKLAAGVTKFGPSLQGLGFGLDQSVALLGSMEKAGIDGEKMFAGLQKAVVNFTKDGKDAQTGLREVFNTIKNSKDPIEASQLALETFGSKVGPDLASAIRSGQFEVENLVEAMQNSEGAIMATAESTADFGEKFQLMKQKAMLALEPIALKTLEIATVFMEKASPHVEAFSKLLSENIPLAFAMLMVAWTTYGIPFTDGLLAVATVVTENVLPPLAALFTFFKENESAWQALAIGIGTVLAVAFLVLAVNAGIAAVSMVVALAPVIALVAGIALLGAAIFLLIKHWDDITAKVPALGVAFDAVKLYIQTVFSAIEGLFNGFKTYLEGAIQAWIGVFKILKGFFTGDWALMWEGLTDLAKGALKMVEGAVDIALAPIKALFDAFGIDIVGIISGAITDIATKAGELPGKITELGPKMLEAGKAFMGDLFTGMKETLTTGGELATDIGTKIIDGVKGLINTHVIDAINSRLSFTIPGGKFLPDIKLDAPDIPHLFAGGIVNGPTLALLGDNRSGREAVVPLERASEMGFGGRGFRDLIVQPPPGFGSSDGAYAKRLLDELRRAGATI